MASGTEDEFDPLADPEEGRVIYSVLDSFASYRRAAHYNVTHLRRQSFYALPSAHWTLLAEPPFSLLDSLSAVDDAIDANADIAEAILRVGAESFADESAEVHTEAPNRNSEDANHHGRDPPWKGKTTKMDLDKARSTIRQLYRDWSAEGKAERAACYDPVLEALRAEFSHIPDPDKGELHVLVPGAGLGRLVMGICCVGFSVEGNEISYHQLMASNMILNDITRAEQYPLYPWALSSSNHVSRADQLQGVMIPDVHPAAALEEASIGKRMHASERMSMSAGDFCVVYKNAENSGVYNAVTTVFFIDTAPNLIAYIETIRNCLKTGGIWINLGPLLWHFENNPPGSNDNEATGGAHQNGQANGRAQDQGIAEPGSMELTDDEVVALVERFGFKIEKHEVGKIATGYIQDPRSMLMNIYRPSFWVARKQ
ncbi:hypothetical protein H2201_002656 [Coniosporium apollinis]|uniref:carnosine N-methyltransferase n=1 Tax=Coniosporium apollinis TaxID=61459 RepID=A0ABQ9NZI4_9PEZI|nr:hypothetical protein H2201_002656 [Coniosporium apollinis]